MSNVVLACLPRVCSLCKPGSTRWRNASDVYRGVKCHISLSLSLSPRIGFMCAGSSSAVCKCLLELASWNNSFVCEFSFCSLLMYHCWQMPVFPILLVLAAIEAHCNVRDICNVLSDWSYPVRACYTYVWSLWNNLFGIRNLCWIWFMFCVLLDQLHILREQYALCECVPPFGMQAVFASRFYGSCVCHIIPCLLMWSGVFDAMLVCAHQ